MVVGSGGSGGVADIMAYGRQGVLKQYFPLEWQNWVPMLGGSSGGGGKYIISLMSTPNLIFIENWKNLK